MSCRHHCKACAELNGALDPRLVPEHRRGTPAPLDVAQRQVEQLGRCPVMRKMAPRAHRTPYRAVQTLDRIGRVDRSPDRLRKREERDDLLPATAPATGDRRVLLAPRTRFKRLQFLFRGGQREVCSPCANSPSRTGRVPRNRSRLTQIWLREGIPERQGREISCRPASNSPLPGPVTPKSEAA